MILCCVVALVALASPTSATPAEPVAPSAGIDVLTVAGHGYGHRRGLGQYGSLGYAVDHAWSSDQIVSHFYGNTTAGTIDPKSEMTVRILGNDGRPVLAQVDSGGIATFTPGGAPVGGSGRAVKIEPASGGFKVSDAPSCDGPWTPRSGVVSATELRVRPADLPPSTIVFSYGTSGDVALTGDWNGDGVDTPAVWRSGTFHLRNSSSTGAADLSVAYGRSSDVPLVGDWNGDGVDTVGVRRGNAFLLRNSNSPGGADVIAAFGSSSDQPLVGDWNGDGADTLGVRRGNQWLLRDANSAGSPTYSFGYGSASDLAVVGNWDGAGGDGIGVRRGTAWYLRNALSAGTPSSSFDLLGAGTPVAGRWEGGASDRVGRFAAGYWELDRSGGRSATLLDGNNLPIERTLQLCNAASAGGWSSVASTTRYYRGELRAVLDSGSMRTVNAVQVDSYLRGVVPGESPSSWGTVDCASGAPDCGRAALEAQAIAARSYSWAEARYGYAKTCDTTSCQVYYGRAYRSAGGAPTSREAATTDAAVAATAGKVRRTADGKVARTEFSSSTGGVTVGASFPSVIDDGDDTASNPYHNWFVDLTATSLQAKYGQSGGLLSARVTSRSTLDGGRGVTGLELVFGSGTVTRTGDQFRLDWGLRSAWFDFPGTVAAPVASTPGIRRAGQWYLRTDPGGGPAQISLAFGAAGDVALVGDWDGNGVDGVGVRQANTWYLRNPLSTGDPDIAFSYGASSDVALVGDWDGNGVDGVGVRRGNTWYLRNPLSTGDAQISFAYGAASDLPVVGDWNGDAHSELGVFRDGVFYLRSSLSPGDPTLTISTGLTGTPVVGDWDGDGAEEVGVLSGNTWTLINDLGNPASRTVFSYGTTGDVPVPGRWG